jgi:formiminotetrahydrofolate cyclodeaminase
MSGALSAMVSNLTFNKKGYEKIWDEAKELSEFGQNIKERSLIAIDSDTQAFYNMINATRLPKKTDEDKNNRNVAIQEATKRAILVPLETLEIALEAAELAAKVAKIGNTNALSDAGVEKDNKGII